MAQVNHGYPAQIQYESQYRNNCSYTFRSPGISGSPVNNFSVGDMEAVPTKLQPPRRELAKRTPRRFPRETGQCGLTCGVGDGDQVSRGEETPSWEYNDAAAEEASSPEDAAPVSTMVEMFVPFYSKKNVRDVVHRLQALPGVEHVSADQWDKKVVVRGTNLSPDALLRMAQIDHKYRSASMLWSDRQSD